MSLIVRKLKKINKKLIKIKFCYNPMDIFKSSWFQIIAGSIAFFILLCVLNVLFSVFEHKTELTESAAAASGGFSLSSMFKNK